MKERIIAAIIGSFLLLANIKIIPLEVGSVKIGTYVALPLGFTKGYLLQMFIPDKKGLEYVASRNVSNYPVGNLEILIPGEYKGIAMKGNNILGVYSYEQKPRCIVGSFVDAIEYYRYEPEVEFPLKDAVLTIGVTDPEVLSDLKTYKSGMHGIYTLYAKTKEGIKYTGFVMWVTPITNYKVHVALRVILPNTKAKTFTANTITTTVGVLLLVGAFLL